MSGPVGEVPSRAPAVAYGIVVGAVPTWYLEEEPPLEGVELTVVGGDGIPTRWAMSDDVADVVAVDLRRRGDVQVTGRRYRERARR